MLLADDSRRYVAANAAACDLIGRSSAELEQMRVDDLTPYEHRADVPRMWHSFLREGSQTGRYQLVVADGRRLDIEFSATANVLPGCHLSIFVTTPAPEPTHADSHGALTPREREILGLIAMGKTGPEIAEDLGVSPKTVGAHTGNILEKLRARTRAQAIAIAIQRGDLALPSRT